MSNEDKTRNFQRKLLDEAISKGIQKNEEQCKIWTNYKNGHLKVIEALNTLPNDLYMNCMVPVGKRAMLKGKLIHTNEVLVCLGAEYFAKYSAKNAIALCERRIKRAEEMLENLRVERDLFETRMITMDSDIFGDCGGSEIIEHWDEQEVNEWRVKHREKEKEYHKKLSKIRQEERKKITTEEDLFERLDQLELEEELADELDRLEDEGYELVEDDLAENESESATESDDDATTLSKTEHSPNLESTSEDNVKKSATRKSITFVEPVDDRNNEKLENSKIREEECFEDEGDICRIEFTHSQNEPVFEETGKTVKTPRDIYEIFSRPKSILKRSPNDILPQQIPPPDPIIDEEDDIDDKDDYIKPSAYEAVVKDIQERNTEKDVNISKVDNKTRPISKFRKDRGLKK